MQDRIVQVQDKFINLDKCGRKILNDPELVDFITYLINKSDVIDLNNINNMFYMQGHRKALQDILNYGLVPIKTNRNKGQK